MVEYIMTIGGVEIYAKINKDSDQIEVAKMNTISAMIRNAFTPKRDKKNEIRTDITADA